MDGSHDTHATFILSSSTLNLRHFSIVIGSKCKGIMGTVVLCTSCPLLSEYVISHTVCFPQKKSMRIYFFPVIQYYTLVHDHIWISYFIFYFPLLECRFIPRLHRNTLLFVISIYISSNEMCTNRDEVHPLSSFEVVFNHMAHFGMLSDVLIVFLITPECCKPSFFGLPFRKSRRKTIYELAIY